LINYVKGDATYPKGEGFKHIIHIVNDEGKWGAGFVLAISRRWKNPEISYKKWYSHFENFELGKVQFVPVEHDIVIANMVAQRGTGQRFGPPIRYDALDSCLKIVSQEAREKNASIHGPRFGAGLAGGDWKKIESLINENLFGLNVTIYDL
jgi:O-acetyl-ADP-ribose deacetylase (regulator of RNase III)